MIPQQRTVAGLGLFPFATVDCSRPDRRGSTQYLPTARWATSRKVPTQSLLLQAAGTGPRFDGIMARHQGVTSRAEARRPTRHSFPIMTPPDDVSPLRPEKQMGKSACRPPEVNVLAPRCQVVSVERLSNLDSRSPDRPHEGRYRSREPVEFVCLVGQARLGKRETMIDDHAAIKSCAVLCALYAVRSHHRWCGNAHRGNL